MKFMPLRFQIADVIPRTQEVIDWGVQSLGIPELWRQTQGRDIKVAILDTGIDSLHADLREAIVEEFDATESPYGPSDRMGHGTHVAGIIGGRHNGFGIIGVAPACKLYNVKVLDDQGRGSSQALYRGIRWAIDKKVDVINMSLGSPYPDPQLHEVVKEAAGQNIIIIAAAGNYGVIHYFDTVNYPARYEEAISVGSINRNLVHSPFSAGGETLDIVAPGEEVYSSIPMNLYARLSGTSMATPFVSGVVALCLAKHRSAQFQNGTPCDNILQMREHLRKTAVDLGKTGPDSYYGYGLIHPESVLKTTD